MCNHMVIGIDVRCLLESSWGGISWYTYHLLQALLRYDTKNHYIFFYNQRKKSDIKEKFKEFSNISWKEYRYPNSLFHLFTYLFHLPAIDYLMKDCHVIWFPNIHFISMKKCPYIITCHDLSFLFFPDCFSFKMRIWHYLIGIKKLFWKASHIICVSHHTKKDIHATFHIPYQKMTVISPCVSISNIVKPRLHLPYSYLLCMCTVEPRKNIDSIIHFFEQISGEDHLIIVGKKGWKSQKIFERIQKSTKRDKIRYLGYVSEEEKGYLYQQAQGFLYPSYYEGYGIPPKEALYYNIPVMSSWTSSLGEHLQNNVHYIDPYHIEDMHIVYEHWGKNSEKNQKIDQDYTSQAKLLLEILTHVAYTQHRA